MIKNAQALQVLQAAPMAIDGANHEGRFSEAETWLAALIGCMACQVEAGQDEEGRAPQRWAP